MLTSQKRYPGITRACAALVNDTLHGFYTTMTFIDEDDLNSFVCRYLPYYSVPTRWNYLPAIPLTANGKVNKELLAQIAFRKAGFPPVRTSRHPNKHLYHSAEMDKKYGGDEEGISPITRSRKLSDFDLSRTNSIEEEPLPRLPDKNGVRGQRWLRHHVFIVYRKFFTIVVLANLAAASPYAGRSCYGDCNEPYNGHLDALGASRQSAIHHILFRSNLVSSQYSTTLCQGIPYRRHS
jgi:hypothetical protein